MIVSFHPLFEADINIICAGREPDADDLTAIKKARAVILPQGCRQSLYEMARNNCDHFFPNYEARFDFPGKIGQIRLFCKTNTPHPQTKLYPSVADFKNGHGEDPADIPFALPWVFKLDWGGEGETVYLINSKDDFKKLLQKAAGFEKSGQKGFLLQQYVPTDGKTLRVIIIGQAMISYWRIQQDSDNFISSVSRGARIDPAFEPELQRVARALVSNFCRKTGINLAGFDVLFASEGQPAQPLLLEINYFFGRRGLGGSQAYYKILKKEINRWLANALSVHFLNHKTLNTKHQNMKKQKSAQPFAYDLDEADIKRERRKARELRESQWWKRRMAKGRCYYCGSPTPPKELTMDHIVPISRGGKSSRGNVVPCCKKCNNLKKQLLPMEWENYLKQFNSNSS